MSQADQSQSPQLCAPYFPVAKRLSPVVFLECDDDRTHLCLAPGRFSVNWRRNVGRDKDGHDVAVSVTPTGDERREVYRSDYHRVGDDRVPSGKACAAAVERLLLELAKAFAGEVGPCVRMKDWIGGELPFQQWDR